MSAHRARAVRRNIVQKTARSFRTERNLYFSAITEKRREKEREMEKGSHEWQWRRTASRNSDSVFSSRIRGRGFPHPDQHPVEPTVRCASILFISRRRMDYSPPHPLHKPSSWTVGFPISLSRSLLLNVVLIFHFSIPENQPPTTRRHRCSRSPFNLIARCFLSILEPSSGS